MSEQAVESERHLLESLTQEAMFRRASRDPAYFMRTFMWVKDEDGASGRTLFRLFDYQEADLATLVEERFVTVLKARQLGLSTLVAGYALWLALFRPGSNVLWISNNDKNARKAVEMLDMAWRFLPEWFKGRCPRKEGDAAGEKVWVHPDGMKSFIKAYPGTKTAGASETATLVVLDEFALVDPAIQDDLYRSAGATTDAGGSLVIISTARGRHNRFAKMFMTGRRGESRFKAIFHSWVMSRFVNPLASRMPDCPACEGKGLRVDPKGEIIYCAECVDTSIYDAKRADFPDKPWLHRAEYPATEEQAFRESGRPRFPWLPPLEACPPFPHRGQLEYGPSGAPTFTHDPEGLFHFTDEALEPERWRRNVVSMDPATGTGGDYTVITAGFLDEEENPHRIASWRSNIIEPIAAAQEAMKLGRWLAEPAGPALIVVEKQGGYGDTAINELVRAEYPRIYRYRYPDRRRRTKAETYGLPVQWQRRPLIIDNLARFIRPLDEGEAFEARMAGIDPVFRSELESFVRSDRGRVEADTGCFDDTVLSAAIWVWVLVQEVGAAARSASDSGPVAPEEQRFDLSHLYEEAEEVRREIERTNRRTTRRWQAAHRRTLTLGGGRRRW
ncbi:MAG: hypothetical protein ACRDUY_03745 [Nitriliruptorales bacterium]